MATVLGLPPRYCPKGSVGGNGGEGTTIARDLFTKKIGTALRWASLWLEGCERGKKKAKGVRSEVLSSALPIAEAKHSRVDPTAAVPFVAFPSVLLLLLPKSEPHATASVSLRITPVTRSISSSKRRSPSTNKGIAMPLRLNGEGGAAVDGTDSGPPPVAGAERWWRHSSSASIAASAER